MPLTDTAVRTANPREKPFKVTDMQGLYLLVNPHGSKLWRLRYRMDGVERKLSIGPYPQITLAEARAIRDTARKQIAFDVAPNAAKRKAQFEASIRAGNSFAKIAEELIAKKAKEGLAEATLDKQRWLLKLLGPEFGKRPVADIMPQELLHELRKHERRGRLEATKQLRSFASRVFRYTAGTARSSTIAHGSVGISKGQALRRDYRPD